MSEHSEIQTETVGPAQSADLDWILTHVHQAIDELEFYNNEFKAFEKTAREQASHSRIV